MHLHTNYRNKMKISGTYIDAQATEVQFSVFAVQGGIKAVHAIIQPKADCDFASQYQRIINALHTLRNEYIPSVDMIGEVIPLRFCRVFLSDEANQMPVIQQSDISLKDEFDGAAFSFIQQQPLSGQKVALWAYFFVSPDQRYNHSWRTFLPEGKDTSYAQTKLILEEYENSLLQQNLTIADNCVRTWFFVRDIDANYKGMVDARRENFLVNGLTPQTHYIASTGIQGTLPTTHDPRPMTNPLSLVQLDTYTVSGLQPNQMSYLYAKSHLNPTDEYGVTFERGTVVSYDHYNEVFISGTASIDNKGQVLHEGNIRLQTERMLENVRELLKEADCTDKDIMQCIVYLRDIADYPIVRDIFSSQLPFTPRIFTFAPVCRPTWLIEMECIAMKTPGLKGV